VFGIDISEYSLKYATRLLKQKFNENQFSLNLGDIQKGLDIPSQSMEFGLMAEILEHIHKPEAAIGRMKNVLKPCSPLWIVVPINGNAMDHITNYQSPNEVELLMTNNGFDIDCQNVFSVKQFNPKSKDKTEIYVAVCVSR
jgi:ubiquinone/menaquinone biosynthesis C-methylase UbiE